jgi:hypothetical protein
VIEVLEISLIYSEQGRVGETTHRRAVRRERPGPPRWPARPRLVPLAQGGTCERHQSLEGFYREIAPAGVTSSSRRREVCGAGSRSQGSATSSAKRRIQGFAGDGLGLDHPAAAPVGGRRDLLQRSTGPRH